MAKEFCKRGIPAAAVYSNADGEFPDDCIVDFDMRLIDLFQKMNKRSLTAKERIRQEYYRVKERLDGKVPAWPAGVICAGRGCVCRPWKGIFIPD